MQPCSSILLHIVGSFYEIYITMHEHNVRLSQQKNVKLVLLGFDAAYDCLLYLSSSSCSGRIRFDSCSMYPQNEIGPSISSSVVLCVFVLLVYIVVLV